MKTMLPKVTLNRLMLVSFIGWLLSMPIWYYTTTALLPGWTGAAKAFLPGWAYLILILGLRYWPASIVPIMILGALAAVKSGLAVFTLAPPPPIQNPMPELSHEAWMRSGSRTKIKPYPDGPPRGPLKEQSPPKL